ncbi:MAG: NAD-dependent epimerase/dehydratase family protein [Candidatus Peribacteraceae bacterium]|nr:NAD-dependent epimerase/dehydratase family protein [Candidatus Peribacteraceae bacterium]
MKVLIIGGAGLIGAGLADVLHNNGHEVLVLDNFTFNSSEHRDIKCKIITGNACSFSTMNRVFASFVPDVVFHLADAPYDKEGVYDMGTELEVAVNVSVNVLRCLSLYKPKFVFLGSSCEVYKGGSKRKVSEKSQVGHFSYTGATKLYLENMFYLASKQYGFVFTSLRFFQTYGNRKIINPKHDVVTFFIDCILRDESVVIVGPNIYIDILSFTDTVQAAYLVFTAVVGGTKLNSINVGSGVGITLYDLYRSLVNYVEGGKNNVFKVPPKRQTRSLVADNSKLKTLGWESTLILEQAVLGLITHREMLINV